MYFRNLLTRRKIKLVQLADIIVNDMNLIRNDVVIVHIALQNNYMIDSLEEDLIYFLKMVVGTGGTLLMPADEGKYSKFLYPESHNRNKSAAGKNYLINEIFRKMTDTTQLSHPSGSLTVWGKFVKWNSDILIKSSNEIDKKDLLDKSYLLKSKIIGIGVPFSDLMFLHAFDYLNNIITVEVNSGPDNNKDLNSDSTNSTIKDQLNLAEVIKSKSISEITDHFENDELKVFSKRGIPFFVVNTGKFYNKMLLLVKNGIII